MLYLGGMIADHRTFFDRKGRECTILTLEDRLGQTDIFVFNDAFERHREIIFTGSAVLVSGKLSKRPTDDKGKVIADWLMSLERVRADEGVGVEVRIETDKADEKLLKKLQKAIMRHSGTNPVYLRVVEPNGDYLLRSRELFAAPSDGLLEELRDLLGVKKVSLGYHPRTVRAGVPNGGGVHALFANEKNNGGNGSQRNNSKQ